MRRVLSFVFCLVLVFSMCVLEASAQTVFPKTEQTIEYLEDGSYIVTEWDTSTPAARSSGSKTKKSTYYSASNKAIFAVSLTGSFTYTYGVSASATGASVSVSIYDNSASYVTKSATYSNATAYGSGTVKYLGKNITLNVQMTCDKYGNIT